jgi:hypothetical protein
MFAYYPPEWQSLASRMVDRWTPSWTGVTELHLPSTAGLNHGALISFTPNANDAYIASPDKTALAFNGSGSHVLTRIDKPIITQYSFSVWLWRNGTTNFRNIITKGLGQADDIEYYTTSTSIFVGVHNRTNGGVSAGIGFPIFPNQTWTHVVVTYDALRPASFTFDGRWQCFYNGIQQPGSSVSLGLLQAPLGTQSALQIGASQHNVFGSTRSFLGRLDDLIIFDAALHINEIQFITQQGRGGGLLMQPPRRRSVAAAIAALVLACETANYSLTNQAAGLFASRLLAADQAQYILSGNAANPTSSRLLSADPASYTATGNDAATICARLLDGGAAAYALTGTDAGLIANRKLTADQAVCFLAGNNAELLRALKLNAGSMALQLDNFAASLLANRKISADGAQYILVVSDANLTGSASGVAPYYYLFLMRGPQ